MKSKVVWSEKSLCTVTFMHMEIILDLNIFISWKCPGNLNVQNTQDLSVKGTALDVFHMMLVLQTLKNGHNVSYKAHTKMAVALVTWSGRRRPCGWASLATPDCLRGGCCCHRARQPHRRHWPPSWMEDMEGKQFSGQKQGWSEVMWPGGVTCPPLSFCPSPNEGSCVH